MGDEPRFDAFGLPERLSGHGVAVLDRGDQQPVLIEAGGAGAKAWVAPTVH
jgi:hypothetical protein